MFIQQKHVYQGTVKFVRKADSYDPSDNRWFFRPYRYLRTNNSTPYTTGEYARMHSYVFYAGGIPGVTVTWFQWELFDRIEFYPSEVIEPDWWSADISMADQPEGVGGKCSLGWNLMSDGSWVMDTALATVTQDAWEDGPVLPTSTGVTFRGSRYKVEVLDCGDQSTPTEDSDWQRYIADSGDATEEAWGIEGALTTSGYRGEATGSRVMARRLDAEGYVTTTWYCDRTGIVYGAYGYQAPFRWVLKPAGTAPVITPDTMDLGRLVESTSFDMEIATDASLTVNLDGQLLTEHSATAGETTVDLEAVWDALTPGWHDVTITAVNDAGYQCSAKRTFIKAYSEIVDDSAREGLAPKYILYSRWGSQLGELALGNVTHRQEINGEDSLDFEASEALAKGDRVLWHDGKRWREHCVVGIDQSHKEVEEASYHCETSMLEDLGLKQLEAFSANGTAQQTLSSLLEGTQWKVGEVTVQGSMSAEWEKKDAYEVLMECAGLYGAEVYPTVECDAGGVVSRKVNFVQKMGEDNGARFEYASNLDGVTKTVLDDKVYTAVQCYGDGITAYVANEDAKLLWGLPDGKGGVMHAVGRFEDSTISDASELMAAGKSWLEQRMTPQVEYKTGIPFASLEGVQLGDTVQVRDNDFTPPLRLFARVGAMDRDMSSGTTSSVTFGNVVSVLPDVLARQYDSIRVVQTALGSITAESMMQGMNALYTTGGSYVCMTAEGGIITANVPLDSDGRPTVTSGALSAVQMSAGCIRTATSVDSDGEWEWSDVDFNSGTAGGEEAGGQ